MQQLYHFRSEVQMKLKLTRGAETYIGLTFNLFFLESFVLAENA